VGRARPSGAALLPDELGRLPISGAYVKWFGPDYHPSPIFPTSTSAPAIDEHYIDGALITPTISIHSIPTRRSTLTTSRTIIGRHFKQPKEGLGPSTAVRRRICGAPCCGRHGSFKVFLAEMGDRGIAKPRRIQMI